MRKTVLTIDYRCRQMITDGGVMGEFFCRGICGNPCGSMAHLQHLFDPGDHHRDGPDMVYEGGFYFV